MRGMEEGWEGRREEGGERERDFLTMTTFIAMQDHLCDRCKPWQYH